jgi:hypothetical protein
MMKRLTLIALAAGLPSLFAQAPTAAPAEYHAMLDKYCVTCHNEKSKLPAGLPLYLDKASLDHVSTDLVVWERVIKKLNVGAMPPQGLPRPDAKTLDGFRAWLSNTLDAAEQANIHPGRFPIHRLNRTEYHNAIRDIFGLDVDVSELLPTDSSDAGFDNVSSALKVTPTLLDRYVTAAVRIGALAVGDPKAEAAEQDFPVRLDLSQKAHIEGLPIGTRGGTLIHYNFPADGDYQLSGALFRTVDSADTGIEGQDAPNQFEITIDGVRALLATFGGPEDHLKSRLNISAMRDEVARRMTVRVAVKAGPHDIGFTFLERPPRSQDPFAPSLRMSEDIHVGADLPKLSHVTIKGPLTISGVSDSPVRARLFVCRPSSAANEQACAKQILSRVAHLAYRRPLTDQDLQPLMKFFDEGRKTGDFDGGIRAALPRILASPAFIFRAEQDPASVPANTPHAVSDIELASRLSFFLWSSIPDEELLKVAGEGHLHESAVLEQQVRRMLADGKAAALTTNFPDQWLALRNLAKSAPDLLEFPNWDLNLSQSMQRETELLFDSVIRENRSALDLLNADYTFVNERLAQHYGIANVHGETFRRVKLTDPNRYGLLGQGSILTLTSVATRTSPVFRGKWVLTNLLDTPPLPPPPNVPPLPETKGNGGPKTMRQRMDEHHANPVCASCHKTIDPVGFALENFGPVGLWRVNTESGPVDAAGVLADGTKVDSPAALRQALASRPNVFVGTLTEKLLIYALGRGLDAYDQAVVRRIVSATAKNDYRMSSIILGIVESKPFEMRVKVAQGESD